MEWGVSDERADRSSADAAGAAGASSSVDDTERSGT